MHYLYMSQGITKQSLNEFLRKACPTSFSNPSTTTNIDDKGNNHNKSNSITMKEEMIHQPPLMGQHESSLDEDGFYNAAKSIWALNGPTAKALCVLHSVDYTCFRQLDFLNNIPDICRQTYAKERFWKVILQHNMP